MLLLLLGCWVGPSDWAHWEESHCPRWYLDGDGDGVGAGQGRASCEPRDNEVETGGDCDDNNATVAPTVVERCDGVDNDCDATVDNGAADAPRWFPDADADGFGDAQAPLAACEVPDGYVADDTDCDDGDGAVNPDAAEVCGGSEGRAAGVDEDCDDFVDDDDSSVTDPATWFADVDGDGYGSDRSVTGCLAPAGFVASTGDCDDADATISPDAVEVCNDLDDDCDGLTDDEDPGVTDPSSWYPDADGDGFGDPGATAVLACAAPGGTVADATDCDDEDRGVNPDAVEVCGGADEDCDTLVDDHDPGVVGRSHWRDDADGDGYGDPATDTPACVAPGGTTLNATDCLDSNPAVNPGAVESCDALDIDEDCDGLADDADGGVTGQVRWYTDEDADGYGALGDTGVLTCETPTGRSTTADDCDDAEGAVHPGAVEVCDGGGVDDDCNALADDDDPGVSGGTAWYPDDDGDGYGDGGVPTTSCEAPPGQIADGSDCDDGDSDIHPGVVEVCADGVDNDCDGLPTTCSVATEPLESADATITGESSGDYVGSGVEPLGDVNGDGFGDLLVSALGDSDGGRYAGAAYVVHGPVLGTVSLRTAYSKWTGERSNDELGADVAPIGDFDGDGVADFAASSPYAASYSGVTYILPSNVAGTTSASSATAAFTGQYPNDYSGLSLAGPGDVTGDGLDDLLVGAGGESAGRAAYLVSGPVSGTASLSTATTIFSETSVTTVSVYGPGDLDGDGVPDLVLATPWTGVGTIYVFQGPTGSHEYLSSASATFTGTSSDAWVGAGLASPGDMTGDGQSDLVIGGEAPYSYAGAAYVVDAMSGGSLGTAWATITGIHSNDRLGRSLAAPGDIDEDGTPDLFVGAYGVDSTVSEGGVSYLFCSVPAGVSDASIATSSYYGSTAYAVTGEVAHSAGDVNGDGTQELVIGGDASTTNKLWLFYVQGL